MSSSQQPPPPPPPPLVEQQSTELPPRSAKDFESEEALRHALTDMNAPGWTMSYDSLFADPEEDRNENSNSNLFHTSSRGGGSMDNLASKDDSAANANSNSEDGTTSGEDGPTELNDNWDWVLTNYDPETTEPQSVNQELYRLKVLMSYMILGKSVKQWCKEASNLQGSLMALKFSENGLAPLVACGILGICKHFS